MKKCQCLRCKKGDKHASDEEERMLKEYGWYAHQIVDSEDHPFGIDFHTHGFGYLFHPDIQICLPVNPKMVHAIFIDLYNQIKSGRKFEYNQKYDEVTMHSQVTFIQVNDDLIRLILPDEDYNLDFDKMKCPYKHQYDIK